MTKKRCSSDECASKVSSGGVCKRHGAKKFTYDCSAVGCTNKAQIGSVCMRHGAKLIMRRHRQRNDFFHRRQSRNR